MNKLYNPYVKEYYLAKHPLYIRQTKEQHLLNLYSPIENLHYELKNLDITYIQIIKSLVNTNKNKTNQEIFAQQDNNQGYKQLFKVPIKVKELSQVDYWWDYYKNQVIVSEKTNKKLQFSIFANHDKDYYYRLAWFLWKGVNNKADWRILINVFELNNILKIKKTQNKNILVIDTRTDYLTYDIFKKIFKFPYIDEVKKEKIPENEYNKIREETPKFNRVTRIWKAGFDNTYYYQDKGLRIKGKYEW